MGHDASSGIPPNGLTMTWHPGRDEETAQELALTLHCGGDGTRVEVVHSGWERLGDRMAESSGQLRRRVGSVLGRFVEAAGNEN